jgi:hypothetical protein
MTPDETNSWIRLQVEANMLCARIELEGMIAENQTRAFVGLSPAYNEDAFRKLFADHNIEYNGVRGEFMKCW